MRYKATVMYDGTKYCGFQIQENVSTIQEEIEKVLYIITKTTTKIYPAGRTDTGVHAYGQVFHFNADIVMTEWNMQNAINSRLPKDIYISKIEHVSDDFHARYSAKTKEYLYVIDIGEYNPIYINYKYYYRHKLDFSLMEEAARIFIGEHDFKSFTKNHKLENTTRIIEDIRFEQTGTELRITFIGNGFLHNMIRIIIAMLIEVGNNNKTKEQLEEILKAKDRKLAPKLAPANGLYLVYINY